jgi:hypothetical protein
VGLSEKSETMAFLGKDTVKCKIIVDNKRLQKAKNFKYLGCEISYENEKNIQQNLENFFSNNRNFKQDF